MSRSFFDLGQRSLRFQSYNLLFSETIVPFETKVLMKACGKMEMIIYINELCRMTKMATIPIYGENLKKPSSPESIDR